MDNNTITQSLPKVPESLKPTHIDTLISISQSLLPISPAVSNTEEKHIEPSEVLEAVPVNTPESKSLSVMDKINAGKQRSLANLKPFKKGENGKAKGKVGAVSIKALVNKRLKKAQAVSIVDNIINGSIQGDDKKQDRLLKLTGDLTDEKSTINITQNTLSLPMELIESARQFLLEKETQKALPIVNVEANPD